MPVVLPGDTHSGPLVEPGGAGLAGRVDLEPDPAEAAPVELAEGYDEERSTEPASAPGPADAEVEYPAGAARPERECCTRELTL